MRKSRTAKAATLRWTGKPFSMLFPFFAAAMAIALWFAVQASGEAPEAAKCPYLEKRAACAKELSGTLDLDESQAARIEEIRQEFMRESGELQKAVRAKKDEIDALFRNPDASQDEIRNAHEALAAIKAEQRKKSLDARLKARSALTPDQIRSIPPGHGLGIGWGAHSWGGKGAAACQACPHHATPPGCPRGKCDGCPYAKKPCGAERGKNHPL